MEEIIHFWLMEDDLNMLATARKSPFLANGGRPQFLLFQTEDDHSFLQGKATF